MPNWKKIIVSGSDAVLNSVTTTNGAIITGSLRVTGSSNLLGNQTITGSLLLTQSYISKVDYVDYTVSPGTLAHSEGRTYWDADRKTLQIDTDVNDFAISAGHVSVLRGRNTNSYTLTKGTVVYINGNSGQFATFTSASWEDDPNSAYTIGLIAQDINANQFGYAVTDGEITGVDTNGFAPATLLYLSSSGQYTSTKPVAPRHTVRLGQVVVASVNGILQVKIDNGYELGELHDVADSTTTSSYGDLLVKSGSLWINSKQLTGSYGLTGSLTATSFTGSLFGTASWAVSASWAPMRPAGANTQIQYNSGSTLAASQFFTFNYLSSSLQQGVTVSATGIYSHAEGSTTIASGQYSHAEGFSTDATGGGSHAEGTFTLASGQFSHAEGSSTEANGSYSHAEGGTTVASGQFSHAEGYYTTATGLYAHAEGTDTDAIGLASHAEGYITLASGSYSHTEGSNTATYSDYSHAEGLYTKTANTSLLVASSSITLNAYNTGSRLLVGDYSYGTTTAQMSYVLWEDADNSQVWLSQIDNIFYEDPDNQGTRPIFQISEFDSQGPDTNVATVGAVYDLASGTSTTGLTAYNYGKLDFDNELIEVYNEDLSIISAGGVLLTVPNSGSYAYDIISVTYSSNTSSISFDSTTNQFSSANSGAPSLTGAVINSGKVILTDIVGVTWAVEGYLISSPISAISHYNVDNKTIKIANSQNYTSVFTPGSYIYFNGDFRLVENSNYSGANTFVTTSVQLGPVYDSSPYYVELGKGSHAGGFYTIASGSHQTVVGQYNKQNNLTDLFVVGGGTENSRKDVFNVSTTQTNINTNTIITGSLVVSGSGTYTYFDSAIGKWASPILTIDMSDAFNTIVFNGNGTLFSDNIEGIVFTDSNNQYSYGLGSRTMYDANSNVAMIYADTTVSDGVRLYGTASYALTASQATTALTASSVSQLNQNIIITGSVIFTPPTSPNFNGEIVRFGAGTLTTGQLYFLSSSGTWSLANANSTGSSTGMLGIAVGSSPTANGLLIRGFAASSSYTYGTTGSVIYMATSSGAMTATSPSSSNHVVRVMGYRTTLSNTIYFDPDKTWVTLA